MAISSTQLQELSELRSQVEWLDEERRKTVRKLADVDQRVALQEREIEGRVKRIEELEKQLFNANSQLARIPQIDTKLQQFKDEIVQLIDGYDQRRLQAQAELERLRRVEHEVQARAVAEVRKEIPSIDRLSEEMELRKAEETRLAYLIGVIQGKIPPIESRIETWARDLAYLEAAEKQNSRHIGGLQAELLEIHKRWEPINSRLDSNANAVSKTESKLQELDKQQGDAGQAIRGYVEQVQLGEYERNKRLESWQTVLDEQQEKSRRFSQEWVGFAEQYQEARAVIQTLPEWQKQLESQLREATEMARVETNRMQSRWENFNLENEKRWKNYEVEAEQRWQISERDDRGFLDQITALEELISQLEQDRELLWRVQSAQADAVKQLPRVWLEEVEKAVAQNPNRRRQPALVQVREE